MAHWRIARLAALFALAATPAMAGFHAPYPGELCAPACPDDCYRCHVNSPYEAGPKFFTEPLDRACTACHDGFAADGLTSLSHPSQVQVGSTLLTKKDFWWYPREATGGTLNCASCHDPHLEKSASAPFLLRGQAVTDTLFCAGCHAATDRHGAAVFLAHGKATGSGPEQAAITRHSVVGSGSGLDGVSQKCISCHDGTTDTLQANYCVIGQQGACAGHIIGIDYQGAATGNPGLETAPDPRIALHEGKIGCASCHDIYSGGAKLLVLDNSGSALCVACHKK